MTPNGLTRRARATDCRTCGRQILAGLDADLVALEAYVDPAPLTPTAEALALLCGRRTWTLKLDAGRIVLDYRDHWRIASRPAGGPTYDVVAEHVCGTRPAWPTTRTALTSLAADPLPEGAPCPF